MSVYILGYSQEGAPDSSAEASGALGKGVTVILDQHPLALAEFPDAKVWIAGGTKGIKAFYDAGLLTGKRRSLKWLRGQAFQHPTLPHVRLMATTDPDTIRYDPSTFSDVYRDVMLARRFLRTGSLAPKLGRYEWVKDLEGVRAYVEEALKRLPSDQFLEVALDLETMGLHPFDPDKKILTVAVTAREGITDVVDTRDEGFQLGGVIAVLAWLFDHPRVKIVGANLKFDLLWLRVKWGLHGRVDLDTCQMGSLLDENRPNSLSNHTFDYVPDLAGYDFPLERTYDKSKMEKVPKPDLLPYAGGDTDACLRAARAQRAELIKESRTPTGGVAKRSLASLYANVIKPTQAVLTQMEHTGVCVDLERFHALGAEWAGEMKAHRKAAVDGLTASIVKKHGLNFDADGKPMAPLSKPQMVIDLLFSPSGFNLEATMTSAKKGIPSVAELHLKQFADHPVAGPFVQAYLAYCKTAKIHSTYYEGWLKHLRPDGRWHSTYATHKAGGGDEGPAGTVNGRASASDPAAQTLPKHGDLAKKLRACMVAPEGYGILSRDFSQGELKVTACWAGEERMIEAYANGMDLHVLTPLAIQHGGFDAAKAIYTETMAKAKAETTPEGKPEWFNAIRKTGKTSNFGLIYGLRANGFVHYALALFGLVLSLEEATHLRDGFFETYPALPVWHERQIHEGITRGYVESPLGRRRRVPLITSPEYKVAGHWKNVAINSPIQQTLGDMMWWAMALILREAPWLLPSAQIHDNGIWYYPLDRRDEALAITGEIMQNLPFEKCFGWKPELTFTSDAEVGPNLAEMAEIKGA